MTADKPLAVVKIGGDVLLDPREREGLVDNISELHQQGWDIVLLHGGGPQVNQLQETYGLKTNKISGRRVTSKEDLKVVKQAIAGEVNTDLVSLLAAAALPAFGCHGASGLIIEATKRPPIKVSGQGEQLIDFGEVGDVDVGPRKIIGQPLVCPDNGFHPFDQPQKQVFVFGKKLFADGFDLERSGQALYGGIGAILNQKGTQLCFGGVGRFCRPHKEGVAPRRR